MKEYFVYILSNKNRTVTYIGVTNNLIRRIHEHRNEGINSFTKKYNVFDLVYFEKLNNIDLAIAREKQLKNWRKEWKWNLIKEQNPTLIDLSLEWLKEN
jgi:putative endonuclease